ncbi:YceD family protein [Neisseriaceae bacterium ESL0693]|nr:YceD family protein [Neisseriaceae bacterium ESL0693]
MLDPILIDTATFTREKQHLCGEISLRQLDERVWSHELLAQQDSLVSFEATGGIDRWQRPFIDIAIKAELQLFCQRCLQAVNWSLNDQAHVILFVSEQALDEAMVADETIEGILQEAQTNLTSLVEDQILMALPFAPLHDVCAPVSAVRQDQDSDSPFAKLAALKSGH